MSSILTNNSAMVALQTLKGINSDLAKTQSEISTGKSVASAKDNAAIWSVSKVMESDVKGFKAISESLSLGESTVAVARQGAETVTDLLTQVKGKIVAAQEENVDRSKIQTDIDQLTKQIGSVVDAAQFNGLNLLNGSSTDPVNVLSSLDRDSSGNVSRNEIEVGRQNLSVTTPTTAQDFGTTGLADAAAAEALIDSANSTTIHDNSAPIDGGTSNASVANNANEVITIGQVSEGDSFQIDLGNVPVNVAGGGTATGARTFEYVASATDGTADVAQNLTNQISSFFEAATGSSLNLSATVSDNQITITNGDSGTSNGNLEIGLRAQTGGTPGSSAASGGLGALQNLDVTSDAGATGALNAIEGLIQKSVDAAASFGSAEGRISTQSEFVSKLTDSLNSGIGSLVDANMEETSARLQALQVQQQLGTQSLSIANQAPQSILSLFR
ncbi:flagellin [Salibaculum sp.]|uniref:flagellin N-terminal helical domain-containing protein n=1 Tax=Salibaculum sp. TaxID=2855480 RepID=UPI002B4685BF|nr:flagellin [Salibaculum sp.]HKL68103.1 flagellin [Salibaculum sp.]